METQKILVIIDMQNDFVDGSLGNKEAENIIPNILNKLKSNKYDRVIATLDTHYDNYMNTREGLWLPIAHCVKGTHGHEPCDEFTPYVTEYLEKETFGSMELPLAITNAFSPDYEIEFVGTCTDICVISNAIIVKSVLPGAKIIVDASCCAGTTIENHNKALDIMHSCQIEVINRD